MNEEYEEEEQYGYGYQNTYCSECGHLACQACGCCCNLSCKNCSCPCVNFDFECKNNVPEKKED